MLMMVTHKVLTDVLSIVHHLRPTDTGLAACCLQLAECKQAVIGAVLVTHRWQPGAGWDQAASCLLIPIAH